MLILYLNLYCIKEPYFPVPQLKHTAHSEMFLDKLVYETGGTKHWY